MATKNEYVPGVCNIGDVEAANRRRTSIGAGIVSSVLWISLLVLNAPAFAFVIIALPAFVTATAAMQSKQRFCAGFGAEGLYNFSDELGKTIQATSQEDRAKDKKKAISITVQATIIGIFVAAIAGLSSTLL